MRLISCFVLLLCLCGCGYHFPGQTGILPAGVDKLYIPLFTNKTSEPQLENLLTSAVSKVFSRSSKILQVENPDDADVSLVGTILDYQTRAIAYDHSDAIGEYRSTIIVAAALRQIETEKLLWEGTISWSSEYNADKDKSVQRDLERQAIEEIVLRLAEEIFYALLDDF